MDRDGILILAVARMRFLKIREKLKLFESIDSAALLRAVSREAASCIVGRSIRPEHWKPELFCASAEKDACLLEQRDIFSTFYWDADYPPILREIFDPPFVLFYRGELPEQDCPAAALVGTRCPTGRAARAAFDLGREFGANGIPVVSGLARGIDKAAHEGTVSLGGKTFAVLGCGADTVYPKEHRKLAEKILLRGGGIISEYAPGTPAYRYNFPERNRIISGLSRAVVVLEAPEKSGALITAQYALDQGRDVYIHEAGIAGTSGAGTRRLHEDGAAAISGADRILQDWGCADTAVVSVKKSPETGGSCLSSQAGLAAALARELEELEHCRTITTTGRHA